MLLQMAIFCSFYSGFPGGSVVNDPSVIQEMQVWSMAWEDPMEKEMATHFSMHAWETPWTEEPVRLQSIGSQNALPIAQVPGWERRLLETMQLVIGEFITDSSQGLPPSSRVWGWKALSPSSLRYLLGQKKQQVVGTSGLVTQLQGSFCWSNMGLSAFP